MVSDAPSRAPRPYRVPPPGAPAEAGGSRSSHRHRVLQIAVAVAAGVLLDLSFAPVSAWPCAVLGVALLSLVVRGQRARRSALLGLVTGLAFFVPLVSWAGTYVGVLPWMALALLESLYLAAMAPALTLAWRAPAWTRPLGVAGIWVLQEGVRMRLPWGGFPWGRLAFATPDAPVGRLASIGGMPLLTFVMALGGGMLALAVEQRRRGLAASLVAGVVALLVAPALVATPRTTGRAVTVALVQGNVPRAGLDFNAQRRAVLGNHVARTHELAAQVRAGSVAAPDLVLWPENSSDVDPLSDPTAAREISSAVDDIGVPTLVGAVLQGPDQHLLNAGILWLPGTGPVSPYYVKRHPAPFGEYIPLRNVARVFSSAVDRVSQDFAAGARVGTFNVTTAHGVVDLGDVICFEVGYDGLVRSTVDAGAQVLAVQTNNATFGHTAQSEQQLDMTRLRAIETGRWVLSTSTSGISAVIAPDGTTVQRTGLFQAATLVDTVRLSDRRTPAVVLGPWPEIALATVGGLALAYAAMGTRRRAGR